MMDENSPSSQLVTRDQDIGPVPPVTHNPLSTPRGAREGAGRDPRHRLGQARATVHHDDALSLQETKSILKARARLLARVPKRQQESDECLHVVEFTLAGEKYAIESAYVREVYPIKELTPLPCTPSFVRGIMNVRGQILSVIDMRVIFGLPNEGGNDPMKVVILTLDDMDLGLLVDGISGMRSIPLQETQGSLPTLTGMRARYLKGVTKDRLAILDAEKILCDKNIIVHEEVDERQEP